MSAGVAVALRQAEQLRALGLADRLDGLQHRGLTTLGGIIHDLRSAVFQADVTQVEMAYDRAIAQLEELHGVAERRR